MKKYIKVRRRELSIVIIALFLFSAMTLVAQRVTRDLINVEETGDIQFFATPNPFETFTVISAVVENDFPGTIIVKDRRGRIVKTIFDGEIKEGLNEYQWDGTNDDGKPLSPNKYLCELTLGTRYTSRTIILILK